MKKILALFALLVAAPLIAAAQGDGFKYSELKPTQPVSLEGKKIEVIEFFWYGCPHCYNLEPLIETWAKKLPPDVQFRRVPAIFNARWGHDAAIFYTFEAMGVLEKLAQWLQKNGVDPKKFNETLKSFTVQSKTRRAVQITTAYAIDGTPAMAVHGRYTVSVEQGGTREGMLQTVSHLVDMIRKGK
jgi:thiol:disulfide interchange protein DsbA